MTIGVELMNTTKVLAIFKVLAAVIALFVFVAVGGASKATAGSSGGSKASTSSSKTTTTTTSSNTDSDRTGQSGDNKKIGDYPGRDINKGGTVAATAGGNSGVILHVDKFGNAVVNKKGQTASHKNAIERATKDVTDEATRTPKNIANFLTGKNDSDKQLIKNVEGGLQQVGKNAQGTIDQIDQGLIRFNKSWNDRVSPGQISIFPSAPQIYNQFKPGEKALGDEAGRGVKNVKQNTDRAITDIQGEAGRTPENVVNFLTGKNDGDKQLIKNIDAGVTKVEQVGNEFSHPVTAIGKQLQRSGQDISNEASRAWKNIGAAGGDAANDVKGELQRAPQNVVNALTGKNDSIKDTEDTIGGGISQLGKNIQAGGDAWQRIMCGPDCQNVMPTSRQIGNAILKGGKGIKAGINRDINKIGTGKNVGRDISRAGDKAGKDISNSVTTAVHQGEDAANHAADQVGNAENEACSSVGLGC